MSVMTRDMHPMMPIGLAAIAAAIIVLTWIVDARMSSFWNNRAQQVQACRPAPAAIVVPRTMPEAAALASPAPAVGVVPLPPARPKVKRRSRPSAPPVVPACRIPIVSRVGTCVFF